MTLTAKILQATYAPFDRGSKGKNQPAYIVDQLYRNYYHQEGNVICPEAPNINGMFRGRRLCPAPIRQYYLDKVNNLIDNIQHRIILRYPNAQVVIDHLRTIIQTSGIYPQDIAYLDSFYHPACTQDEAAKYMAQVIWYVMQTDRLTKTKRAS